MSTTRNRWYVSQTNETGNGSVRLTEVAAERRFQEQCFLMHWLPFFAAVRQSNYTLGHHSPDVFIPVIAEPTEMMSQLTGIGGVRSLMAMTPDMFSMIQPTVRLFKTESRTENNIEHQFDAEFIFPDNISGDPYYNSTTEGNSISKMMTSRAGRGTGVGLKEFSWDFVGTNPVEQDRLITANLILRFNDFEELFMERQTVELTSSIDENVKATVTPKFVDLIMRSTETILSSLDPDVIQEARAAMEAGRVASGIAIAQREYDPTDFQIKAIVGWAVRQDILSGAVLPGTESSHAEINSEIKTAIENTKMILYLTIVDHTIQYREDGTIDLNIEYAAAIEREIESNTNDLIQSTYESARQQQLEMAIEAVSEFQNSVSSPGGCGHTIVGEGRSDEDAQDESDIVGLKRDALERELARLRAESKSVGYAAMWEYLRRRNTYGAARTHTVFATARALGAVDPVLESGAIPEDISGTEEFGATPNEDLVLKTGNDTVASNNSAGLFVEDTAELRTSARGTTSTDPLIPDGRDANDFAFQGAQGAGLIDALYMGAPAGSPSGYIAGTRRNQNRAGLGVWPTDTGGALAGLPDEETATRTGEPTAGNQPWVGQSNDWYNQSRSSSQDQNMRADNLRGKPIDGSGLNNIGASPIAAANARAALEYHNQDISGPSAVGSPGDDNYRLTDADQESEFYEAYQERVQEEEIYWTRPIKLGTTNNNPDDPSTLEDDVVVYPVQFVYYGELLEWAIKKSLMRFEYDPNVANNWLSTEMSFNDPAGVDLPAGSSYSQLDQAVLGPYVLNPSWRHSQVGQLGSTQNELAEVRNQYIFSNEYDNTFNRPGQGNTSPGLWQSHLNAYRAKKASLDKLQIVLGCISYWDHASNSQRYINLADIPISMNLFSAWWMSNVVRPGKLEYHLLDFIKDTMRGLILDVIGGADCYESANFQMFDVGIVSYTSKGIYDEEEGRYRSPLYAAVKSKLKLRTSTQRRAPVQGYRATGTSTGNYHYIRSENGTLSAPNAPTQNTRIYRVPIGQLKQDLIDIGSVTPNGEADTGVITDFTYEENESIPVIPHIAIYARGYNVNHLRGYETADEIPEGSEDWSVTGGKGDVDRGIYHLHLGEMAGLLKSMQFYKTEQRGLAESRIMGQGVFNYAQLRGRYDVRLVMYGNTFFLPGQMIYIDPTSVGTGHGTLRKLDALMLGLGGYFQIVEVSSVINSDSFETEVRAIWHGSGIAGIQELPHGGRPNCVSAPEAIAYAERVLEVEAGFTEANKPWSAHPHVVAIRDRRDGTDE
jgi:hypothetical protein